MKNTIRSIVCNGCDWEEFPADMPRHKAQSFVMVENSQTEDNNAQYICQSCSKVVTSTIEEQI
jgi:hypothetical protein